MAAYKITLDPAGCNDSFPVFQADTTPHAQALAQAAATLWQRTVYLVCVGPATAYTAPPFAATTAAAAGSALGSAPTGITS